MEGGEGPISSKLSAEDSLRETRALEHPEFQGAECIPVPKLGHS